MAQEEYGESAMRSAVFDGDVDALRELVSKGGNPNAKGYDDQPLLIYAASRNNKEIIRYLLEDAHVPIELCNKWGHTALLTAALHGNLDVAQHLVSAGANILARTALDETALHLSARTESVETFKFLQQSGIPMDALDIRGRTALHHAATFGCPKMVEYILQGGWLPVDCQDKNGQTPLMLTADFPRSERDDVIHSNWFDFNNGWMNKVVTLLLDAGADLSIKDVLGRTALHRALGCEKNFLYLWEKCKDFIHSVDKKGQTLIHRALSVFCYHWDMHSIVKLFLEAGADAKSCDTEGRTALYIATEKECFQEVQALIKAGAETSSFGKDLLTKCLHIAVWKQDFELINRLLAEGADINGRHSSSSTSTEKGHTVHCLFSFNSGFEVYIDPSGYPPLFEALRSEKVLKCLIEAGADVNFKDDHGWSTLHKAFHDGNYKVLNMLLDAGADINSVDDCGVSLLHLLSTRPERYEEISKLTERIIQAGARVNVADHNGRTPLHYAANKGNWKYIQYLIGAGGDVNYMDMDGATPLLMITNRFSTKIAQILLDAGADLTISYKEGQQIIHHISQIGNTTAIDYFIDIWPSQWGCDNHGNTVLHFATRSGDKRVKSIEHILMRKLVPVDERNVEGKTALAMLVEHGSNWNSAQHEVELLLGEGASVTTKDNKGKTPLHTASSVGDVKVMEVLIAAGADVSSKDDTGQTPLHWAAKAHNVKGLELLLQKGVILDEQDSDGQTPLMLAVGSSDAVNLLVKKGASINVRDCSGKTVLQQAIDHGSHGAVKFLWAAGSSFMDISQESQIRAVHLAVTAGDEEMLNHLISLGMSLSDCWWDPEHKTTLLHCAAQSSVKMLKKLIDSGHIEYSHDHKGRKPLHLSVISANYIGTKYLVEEAHVPLNDRDADGRTALMLVVSSNWYYPEVYDMVEILVNAGADISAQDKDSKTVYELAYRPWSDMTHDLLDYIQYRF